MIPAAALLLAAIGCNANSARQLLSQKNYEAAVVEFRRAFHACPEQRGILLELAQTLTLARRFDEAEGAARDFLSSQPHSAQGLIVLANVYFMSQRFEDCLKLLAQVHPANIAALLLEANALYLTANEQEAEKTFLRVIELDPENQEATYSLGRIYYQQNRFHAAIARFQRVLELDPKSYKAYDNLGLCYEALNQDREAIRYYLKAIDLVYKDHPEYDWPYANLANLLLKRDENEKAFPFAAQAAQRNPDSARNFYLAGKALARLNKPESAIKWLKRSIELDSNYPEPRYLLAQLYAKQGLKEESQKEFQIFRQLSAKQPRNRR